MKTIFSLLMILLCSQRSFCQDYVVTAKGDTLRGSVKPMRYFGGNSVVLTLTNDRGEPDRKHYDIYELKAFQSHSKVYESIAIAPGHFDNSSGVTYSKVFVRKLLTAMFHCTPLPAHHLVMTWCIIISREEMKTCYSRLMYRNEACLSILRISPRSPMR